jgi:hypothetical protein
MVGRFVFILINMPNEKYSPILNYLRIELEFYLKDDFDSLYVELINEVLKVCKLFDSILQIYVSLLQALIFFDVLYL